MLRWMRTALCGQTAWGPVGEVEVKPKLLLDRLALIVHGWRHLTLLAHEATRGRLDELDICYTASPKREYGA